MEVRKMRIVFASKLCVVVIGISVWLYSGRGHKNASTTGVPARAGSAMVLAPVDSPKKDPLEEAEYRMYLSEKFDLEGDTLNYPDDIAGVPFKYHIVSHGVNFVMRGDSDLTVYLFSDAETNWKLLDSARADSLGRFRMQGTAPGTGMYLLAQAMPKPEYPSISAYDDNWRFIFPLDSNTLTLDDYASSAHHEMNRWLSFYADFNQQTSPANMLSMNRQASANGEDDASKAIEMIMKTNLDGLAPSYTALFGAKYVGFVLNHPLNKVYLNHLIERTKRGKISGQRIAAFRKQMSLPYKEEK